MDFIKNKTELIFADVLHFCEQMNQLISFVMYSGFDLKFYANAQTYSWLFTLLKIHLPPTFFPPLKRRASASCWLHHQNLPEEDEKDLRLVFLDRCHMSGWQFSCQESHSTPDLPLFWNWSIKTLWNQNIWHLMSDSPQIGCLSSSGGISSVALDERVFVVTLVLKTRSSPSPCYSFTLSSGGRRFVFCWFSIITVVPPCW